MKTSLLASFALSLATLMGAPAMTPWQDLHRVPIPEQLPPHPRVFCTPADLTRVKADHAKADPYTVACWERIVSSAEAALADEIPAIKGQPSRATLAQAALLGQAYALTDHARFGAKAHGLLLAISRAVMPLKRSKQAGLMTGRTLEEGPPAVNFAMAYDLAANHPAFTPADHKLVCAALRRVGWEAGHWCGHRDSSNWRSWALCIEAACGFASGDRQLIEEAVNGAWDPQRECYLYGVVQQLTHSVFSDGIHWERCMGYTYYTGSALMYAIEAAKNSGIDLWHAELPGILGPFVGGTRHEEYGPAGNRSFKAFLDAPFYYAFPGGGFARVGDSGTRSIQYHPMYEMAWQEYRDPKYAWLINRERQGNGRDAPGFWQVWRPKGEPEWELAERGEPKGSIVLRLVAKATDRVALVQDVPFPGNRPLIVTGRVKAIAMAGGKAHIRCNLGKKAYFTQTVEKTGDWQEVRVEIPAGDDANTRRVRLHVFLEGGEGEVLWDDIQARVAGKGANLVRNGEFAIGRVDGRRMDFWSLINGVPDVPEGEWDLSKDAAIGLTGRNTNGSTIFPIGGFAVLRSKPNDPDALAVNLSFGPYGSGHDHPDRLTITVQALGRTICPDAGSWGYSDPMQRSWCNQSVAHNTMSIDEIAQEPQRMSKSIWAGERGDQRVFGTLQLFHSGPQLKAVRATCDTAYPGTRLDRTVCLVGPYMLDVYRATSDKEQTLDLPLHGRGKVTTGDATTALKENPFTGLGYAHFEDIRQLKPAGLVRATFTKEDRKLEVLQVAPEGSEAYLVRDPAKGNDRTSCLLARVRGTAATFVTVLAPTRGERTVGDVATRHSNGELWVEIAHAKGTDRLFFPDRLDGSIRLERLNPGGKIVAREAAKAWKQQ
jgi:hypothetical protein